MSSRALRSRSAAAPSKAVTKNSADSNKRADKKTQTVVQSSAKITASKKISKGSNKKVNNSTIDELHVVLPPAAHQANDENDEIFGDLEEDESGVSTYLGSNTYYDSDEEEDEAEEEDEEEVEGDDADDDLEEEAEAEEAVIASEAEDDMGGASQSGDVNIEEMDESSTANQPPKINAVKKRRNTTDISLSQEENNWSIQYLYKKASDAFTANRKYTFKPFSAEEYGKYVDDFIMVGRHSHLSLVQYHFM